MKTVLDHFQGTTGNLYVQDVDTGECRAYAQKLHSLYKDDETLAASTTRTYYNVLRGFLDWCVDEEYLDSNPAKATRAEKPLPKDETETEQEFWSPQDRKSFLSFVDRRNDHAHDEKNEVCPYVAQRDQCLVYLIGLTGARGSEVFRVRDDHKRDGLRWKDIDDDAFKVFGKSRDIEWIGFTGPERERLERWKVRYDPSDPSWPVFPTLYPGVLHRDDWGVGKELEAAGYEKDDWDHPIEACAAYDICPPALSLRAARKIVRRLSEEAGLPSDGSKPHLNLHGARRGLGHDLYEENPVVAQRTLRHKSITTTHEMYTNKKARETGEERSEILDL